jgi:hypothetical protein
MRVPTVTRGRLVALGFLVALLVVLYQFRALPIIRGPYMTFLVQYPALFWGPLFAGLLFGGGHYGLRALLGGQEARRLVHRHSRFVLRFGREWNPWMTFGASGIFVFLVCALMASAWTQSAISHHVRYAPLDIRTLEGGEVRVKPYEVARRQLFNSFNSPTERVTEMHVVNVGGQLTWSAFRDPSGYFRTITKSTTGIITSDAETSSPRVTVHGHSQDGEFKYGPGMRFRDNVHWRIYKKRCYTCDIAEMVAVPTPDGPVLVAPYLRYKGGLFVRRPVFGGVFVVHTDGRIEDLSPREAARNRLVSESGRMFPVALARRYADAYKYHLGVWNRLFTHTDGYEVADVGENAQPYLQKFAGMEHAQWVTTMTPRGRRSATGGVMLTDAVTGATRFWKTQEDLSLIGNAKALDIVRGERLGVNFAGAFQAVEPRQVFPGGRLHFLISVVPQEANRSTLNVVVDAENQNVVKVFPANDAGDKALTDYLNGKEVPDDFDFEGGDAADPDAAPTRTPRPGPTGPATDEDAQETLQRLLEQNREQQEALREQEADLERLLEDKP